MEINFLLKIRQYQFFDYSAHEALFLSEKEEVTVTDLIYHIQQEYQTSIDKFSQDIIISLLESLLHYADRFYQRQFITRKISNHSLVDRLDQRLGLCRTGTRVRALFHLRADRLDPADRVRLVRTVPARGRTGRRADGRRRRWHRRKAPAAGRQRRHFRLGFPRSVV